MHQQSSINLHRYQQARISRDESFDGKIFIAVNSTKIFCRNICTTKLPAEKNVIYFTSIIAAIQHGFRPCLRCSPESAPKFYKNFPLSLIDSIEIFVKKNEIKNHKKICTKFNISLEELDQLFIQKHNVTLNKYLIISNCLFSKKLLTETNLSIENIAIASNFNSVNELHANFKKYIKIPILKIKRKYNNQPSDIINIILPYRPPYNWGFFIQFQKKRIISNIEWINDKSYGRSFKFNQTTGYFNATYKSNAILISLKIDKLINLQSIVENITRLFDIDADINSIDLVLTKLEPLFTIKKGIRLPGVWSIFEAGVRAICGQQISVSAAHKLISDLVKLINKKTPDGLLLFPDPSDILTADLSTLKTINSKKETIHRLAKWYTETNWPDQIDNWHHLKGIGKWTINYVKLRALGYPDVWIDTDLGIKKSLLKFNTIDSENYQPYRSYLSYQLWGNLDN